MSETDKLVDGSTNRRRYSSSSSSDDLNNESYTELLRGSVPCPTCRGLGHIPKEIVRKDDKNKEELDRNTALLNAYDHIKKTGDPIRKTARMYGVPESTLRTRLNKARKFDAKMGRPTIFTEAEESKLAGHCQKMADIGYGFSKQQILDMANNMVLATGGKQQPKKEWYYRFLKRFPDVIMQKPPKQKECRVQPMVEDTDGNYYRELESTLSKYQMSNKPELIWYVGEIGITLDTAVLESEKENSVDIFFGKDGRNFATCTVMVAGSATGETIPPFVIYKGQRLTAELCRACVPNSKFAVSDTGLTTSKTFKDFIENHFTRRVKSKPCLLLYDGYAMHVTPNVVELTKEKEVHLQALPVLCSHEEQLDEDMFDQFKVALSLECQKLMDSQVGRRVTRQDLPAVIASSYNLAVNASNLINGFERTGIVPYINPVSGLRPSDATKKKSKPQKEKDGKKEKGAGNKKGLDKESEPGNNEVEVRSACMDLLLSDIGREVVVSVSTGVEKNVGEVQPGCSMVKIGSEKIQCTDSGKRAVGKKWKLSKQPEKVQIKNKRPDNQKLFKSDEKKTDVQVVDVDGRNLGEIHIECHSDTKQSEPVMNVSQPDDENIEACCCVCNAIEPPDFELQADQLIWGRCDSCNCLFHLKYCVPLKEDADGQHFTCPNC